MVIEPNQDINDLDIKKALLFLKKHPKTQMIENVFVKKHFPVDVRHQIKIDRLKLAREFSEVLK